MQSATTISGVKESTLMFSLCSMLGYESYGSGIDDNIGVRRDIKGVVP